MIRFISFPRIYSLFISFFTYFKSFSSIFNKNAIITLFDRSFGTFSYYFSLYKQTLFHLYICFSTE